MRPYEIGLYEKAMPELSWPEKLAAAKEAGYDVSLKPMGEATLKDALDNEEYDRASELQLLIKAKVDQLTDMYNMYKKNLF